MYIILAVKIQRDEAVFGSILYKMYLAYSYIEEMQLDRLAYIMVSKDHTGLNQLHIIYQVYHLISRLMKRTKNPNIEKSKNKN